MQCEQAELHLAQMLFDELEPDVKARLQTHLGNCRACSDRLNDLRVTLGLLGNALQTGPAPTLTPERRAALLAAAAQPVHVRPAWFEPLPLKIPFKKLLGNGVATGLLVAKVAAVMAIFSFLVALFLPALGAARRTAPQMQSSTQLRAIQQGMILYAQGNDGRYPDDPSVLLDGNFVTPQYFLSPMDKGKSVPSDFDKWSSSQKSQWVKDNSSYVFVHPGDKEETNSQKIIGFEKPTGGKSGVSVVFDDNSTRFMQKDEAEKLVQQQTGKSLEMWSNPSLPIATLSANSGREPWTVTDGDDWSGSHVFGDNKTQFLPQPGSVAEISKKEISGPKVDATVQQRRELPGPAATVTTIPPNNGNGNLLSFGAGVATTPPPAAAPARQLFAGLAKADTGSTGNRASGTISDGEVAATGRARISSARPEADNWKDNVNSQTESLPSGAPRTNPHLGEITKAIQPLDMIDAPIKLGRDRESARVELADKQKRADATAENMLFSQVNVHDALPAPVFRAGPVNPWVLTQQDRFSTFALDVDTASYTIARSYINRGQRPPRASVRMEEYVNSFDYNYPRQSRDTFAVFPEAARSPFAEPGKELTLLKIGVQARVLGREGRKPAHLTFVIDTSGSMARPDRLPLVQSAIEMLVDHLSGGDRVSIVTFGPTASLITESTPASDKKAILDAVRAIRCQGSTNLMDGLRLGYTTAERSFVAGEINRVILCSDGVANIGQTNADEILKTVESYRKNGVTFTSAGFGSGAYNDDLLEKLADRGDGNYVYVDSEEQAKHVFVDQMAATLQTVAEDAKIQVEFNPARVRRYRLIGYENRAIADKDFRNDAVTAGQVGSGQAATALYELELLPGDEHASGNASGGGDLGTVFVRSRNIDTGKVEEISRRLESSIIQPRTPSNSPRFYLAAAAARFAEILRGSEHVSDTSLAPVERVLQDVGRQLPLDSQVQELLRLVQQAEKLPPSQ